MTAAVEPNEGAWEVVVGIETHAQVASRSKLFSGASTAFGGDPNTQVSLVDAAMPGMLPVLNAFCIEQAVRTGLGLNARINRHSVFHRKNYFYPDLPAGYQISQYSEPIVGEGVVRVDLPDGGVREVGIERLHLEQDAGKSLHDRDPNRTSVDLNRAGVALMEIVSRPDLRSAEEAGAYIRKLRAILRYLGTCDGNMEEGSLRCDVNVSVRKPGAPYGTRAEIKNVNSIRFLQQAIAFESRRQIAILEDGGCVEQETRLFDAQRGETRPMRSKEEAHDYRYFPDPDLLPLELTEEEIERVRRSLPELPDRKKARLQSELGISAYHAGVLTAEKESAAYFEDLVAQAAALAGKCAADVAQDCANVVATDLFGLLNREGRSVDDSPLSPSALAGLLALKYDGTISGRTAKDVFEEMFATGRAAADIVAERGLGQVSDAGALESLVDRVLAENPRQLEQYREGKKQLFGFFVGQVMKATKGQANPGMVNRILRARLGA